MSSKKISIYPVSSTKKSSIQHLALCISSLQLFSRSRKEFWKLYGHLPAYSDPSTWRSFDETGPITVSGVFLPPSSSASVSSYLQRLLQFCVVPTGFKIMKPPVTFTAQTPHKHKLSVLWCFQTGSDHTLETIPIHLLVYTESALQ